MDEYVVVFEGNKGWPADGGICSNEWGEVQTYTLDDAKKELAEWRKCWPDKHFHNIYKLTRVEE